MGGRIRTSRSAAPVATRKERSGARVARRQRISPLASHTPSTPTTGPDRWPPSPWAVPSGPSPATGWNGPWSPRRWPSPGRPWVNVIGSFVLGVVVTLVAERWPGDKWLRPLVAVGFCGGFTTFSTFAVEIDQRIRHGHGTLGYTWRPASWPGSVRLSPGPPWPEAGYFPGRRSRCPRS